MTRSDFQTLSRIRLSESRALLKAGFPSGAYYLAGYSLEFALKACIAKRTKRYDFPDKRIVDASYTHNLWDLVKVAGLEGERSVKVKTNLVFNNNWDTVKEWSERSRYQEHEIEKAQGLIEAISNPSNGILAWLKQHS